MIDLTRDGEVFVLTMHDGENRLSPPMLDALDAALTEVAEAEGPRALVTTGSDRFYSNGLDLDWLGDHPDEMLPYLGRVHALFARILSMPCATVAACNGHTFAAGAMLAIAHDVRVMRSDRGYWCLPEVDLSLPLPAGTPEILRTRLTPANIRDLVLSGARIGADEALRRGVVDEACAMDALLPRALEIARARGGKDRANFAVLKRLINQEAVGAIEATG
ncbi:MAG: enoyl-CoA hydratase/isomerase family protein [Myxococcales bacterium]|nr:enoyl-CoA hydratase/isomerase family protein [Myxococcales bacterium]